MKKSKEIRRKLKEAKKQIPATEKEFIHSLENLNGDCEIDVVISKDNLYHPLCSQRQKSLNPEIFEYIDKTLYYVPVTHPVQINFCGDVEDESTQQFITKSIKYNYLLQIDDRRKDLVKNALQSISLFILGIILYIVYFIVVNFVENQIFSEIISIAATFSIWETVDLFLIQRPELKIDLINIYQVYNAKIEFIPNKNKAI